MATTSIQHQTSKAAPPTAKATGGHGAPVQAKAAVGEAAPGSKSPNDKVSLSKSVLKDSHGIPLPASHTVKVERWGKGNNDKACLEGILRSGGYSQKELYEKGADGKSLLTKIAAQNGLKDPNLVQPGQAISFVPKEEKEIYDARTTTFRRDQSLKQLAKGPVQTAQGSVTPKEGFKALADASLDRLSSAYERLPEAGRKGVEEQLTVAASDWSKKPGNQARFERASAEDKQALQRMWLAQGAGQYARAAGAQGNRSDLLHLADGSRQYLEARNDLLGQAKAPASECQVPVQAKAQGEKAQGAVPQAPLAKLIYQNGAAARQIGAAVTGTGTWLQDRVNGGVAAGARGAGAASSQVIPVSVRVVAPELTGAAAQGILPGTVIKGLLPAAL